ncbi:MAG: hypothetical protein RLZZ45_305 [Bacteroidota bacterium]
MKWIRPFLLWVLVFYSSFLFAEGWSMMDTLPGMGSAKQLPTVLLRRQSPLGSRSGDTLVFDAQRYARPTSFRLEELIRDIPGFRVDGEGRIYFNGKEISRIMIDGDDLSGEHYRLLSRNLRSMMVEKLELIQDHQPNRLLKGYDLSSSPAINIRIKKEYKGRPSGSGSVGMGTRKLHQLALESVWVLDSLKQMLFLDHNNTGTIGVVDRWDYGGEKNPRSMFDVHPFPFVTPEQPVGLSAGQSSLNNDLTATSLSGVKTKQGLKMNLVATVGKYQLQQEQLIDRRLLLQKETDPLKLLQRMSMRRSTSAVSLRSSWEKDHGENHLVKNVFQLALDQSDHHHAEDRSGMSRFAIDVQQQERDWKMQWDRESTRKLEKGWVLQQENRIAFGAVSVGTAMTMKNESDSLIGYPSAEKFYRKGFLFANHVGLFFSQGNLRWKWGWRTAYETSYSSVFSDRLGYRQMKSYPYAEFVWSPQKRIAFHTLAAGGLVLYGEQVQKLGSIHSIEQRLQWKFKRLLQFQLSSGVKQQSGDLRDLLVGPFTTREGVIRLGNRAMMLPASFHVSIAGTQVNLHAGRSWALILQYVKRSNEIGNAIHLNSRNESWQPILLGSRHTWSYDMQGEQYLLLLKSKIRLHWNGFVSVYPQVINGVQGDVFLQSASTDLAIIQQSARKAGFEIRYHQINSRHHLVNKQSMKNNVQQKTVVANVWWRICAPIHASFSYGQLLNGRNSMMDISWLADFGKRWKLSLAVQNLLNQSSYRLTVADDLGITTIDQHLNGRRILFSVRYIF